MLPCSFEGLVHHSVYLWLQAKRGCPGIKSKGTGPLCVGDPCAGRPHLLLEMTGARVFLTTPATHLAVTLHGLYLAV